MLHTTLCDKTSHADRQIDEIELRIPLWIHFHFFLADIQRAGQQQQSIWVTLQ